MKATLAIAAMLLSTLTTNVAISVSASEPDAAIGPIAISETRAAVEKTLGGAAPACHVNANDSDVQHCYSDADGAVLMISYGSAGEAATVSEIWLSQKAIKGGSPAAKSALHFSTWKWFGKPAFADALPAAPPGWNVDGTGAKYISLTKGAYSGDKTLKPTSGWLVTLGEE